MCTDSRPRAAATGTALHPCSAGVDHVQLHAAMGLDCAQTWHWPTPYTPTGCSGLAALFLQPSAHNHSVFVTQPAAQLLCHLPISHSPAPPCLPCSRAGVCLLRYLPVGAAPLGAAGRCRHLVCRPSAGALCCRSTATCACICWRFSQWNTGGPSQQPCKVSTCDARQLHSLQVVISPACHRVPSHPQALIVCSAGFFAFVLW